MSHFSPLLWLCAVSAAALNSFTALDPTGAYEQYLDALGENTPAIAAFFDAAESGVFPWTIPGVSEPIPSPVPDLLPQPPEVVDPVIPDAILTTRSFSATRTPTASTTTRGWATRPTSPRTV